MLEKGRTTHNRVRVDGRSPGEAPGRAAVPGLLLLLSLGAVTTGGCPERDPADKVRRWATEVRGSAEPSEEEPDGGAGTSTARASSERAEGPDAGEPSEVEEPSAEGTEPGGEPDAGVEPAGADAKGDEGEGACHRLVERACEALGPYSQECLQIESMVPKDPRHRWRRGCERILRRRSGFLAGSGSRVPGDPCEAFADYRCRTQGEESVACRRVRQQADRLRADERRATCLGGLLFAEIETLFSGPVTESGR